MSNYKKGDITQNGWEVLDVVMKTIYKMRKRVTINDDALEHNEQYIGKKGWWYFNGRFNWVELDDYPGKQFRFRELELNQNKDDGTI